MITIPRKTKVQKNNVSVGDKSDANIRAYQLKCKAGKVAMNNYLGNLKIK